jgi:hypothetical protein
MNRLEEAKSLVQQPRQQTVKLKLSEPRLKIKLGMAKDSPSSTRPSTPGLERSTPGVIVNQEALERQQQAVHAAMNGVRTANGTRNPFSSTTPVPPLSSGKSRSGSAASPPRQVNGLKNEGAGNSPALGVVNPAFTAAVRHSSGSPHPQAQPNLLPALYPPSNLSHHTTAYADGPPPGLLESKNRPKAQSEYSEAILYNHN